MFAAAAAIKVVVSLCMLKLKCNTHITNLATQLVFGTPVGSPELHQLY
jgi:hypothetical protein